VENICPICRTPNESRAKFCKSCGIDMHDNFDSKQNENPRIVKKGVMEKEVSGIYEQKNVVYEKNFQYSFMSMFLSLVITICFQKYVATSFNYNNFFHRILIPSGDWLQILIPLTIIFLFFWAFFDLFGKFIRNILIYRALNNKIIKRIPDLVNQNTELESIEKELMRLASIFKKNIIFRRIQYLVFHIYTTSDIHRSHEFFKHQIDVDIDNAQSGFTIIRVFIWAMPILGFIGTVVGISSAVGDFSGFLGGDIDQVDRIKMELSKITTGLSYAFDTTLLGLLSSLIAMILTTFVQRKEESSLTNLETLGLNIIANTNYNVTPPKNYQNNHLPEFTDSIYCFSKIIKDSTNQLCLIPDKLSNFFERLDSKTEALLERTEAILNIFDNFTRYLEKHTKEIQNTSESLSKMSTQLFKDIDQIQKISNNLKDSANYIENIHKLFIKLSTILPEFTDTLIYLHERITTIIGKDDSKFLDSIEESLQRLKDIINNLSNKESNVSIVNSIAKFQVLLNDQINAVSENITSFNDCMNSSREKLSKELSMIPYDLDTYQLNLKKESTQLSQCIQTLTSNIVDINQESKSLSESSQLLLDEFSQLFSVVKESEKILKNKYLDFEKLSDQFENTFNNNTIMFIKSLENFTQKVNELKSIQDSTIRAVNSLESFKNLLQSLQATQIDLSQIVKGLSGPLEFRLFPSQQKINAEQSQLNIT